jgi:predicted dehydrogenase
VSAIAPLDVAIAGCGRITEVGYLPALAHIPTVRLVGIADPDGDRCARLAPGVPAYPDLEGLLEAQHPELLVIAAPASTHLPLAREAAEVGVRSLVEKPPARTLADAVALAALDPAPLLGFNRRFDPNLAALRTRVRESGRGPLRLALELSISPGAWGAYTAGDGPLLNLAPHLVDLAIWISEQAPQRVRSVEAGEDDEWFEIEWDGGRADVHVSHASGWRESVDVRDERGRVGRVAVGGLRRRVASRMRGAGSPLPATLGAQLTAVARQHRGMPDDRLALAVEGILVMAVLDGVLRSRLDRGSWVDVPTAESPPR